MNNKVNGSLWARLLATPNNSTSKIVVVALGVCLVSSILVSSAAVLLKPIQKQNEELGRQKEILKVAGLYRPGIDITDGFQSIQTRYVDLHSGQYVDAALLENQAAVAIPRKEDIAGIGKKMRYQTLYLVASDRGVDTIILPLIGKGLWSTVHGFVALSADANTIRAVSFYDHAETPGLGGEISNPSWQAKWQGKNVFGMHGHAQIRVIKGRVNPSSHHAQYEIDGLSGATLTANGITNMVRYWLGEQGFGPYLDRIRLPAKGGMMHE